jgi:hypothetical protein
MIVGNAGWTSGEFQKEMGRLLCAIQAQTEASQIICYKTICWVQLRYVVQRAYIATMYVKDVF